MDDEYIYGKNDVFALIIILKFMLKQDQFHDMMKEIEYEIEKLDGRIDSIPIDRILDRKEDNQITDEEFQSHMSSNINTNIAELDVERYTVDQIRFDFTLTSPAPTQREAKLDDITVDLTDGIGTFTYTDNWGTSGNGTITLKNNQIELKLETTSAAQGALWGLEGIYTFSYKRID